jgi:hypothetical protein
MLDLSKKIRRGFASRLIALHGKHIDASDILKSQRYAARPALEKIVQESILNDRVRRDWRSAKQ